MLRPFFIYGEHEGSTNAKLEHNPQRINSCHDIYGEDSVQFPKAFILLRSFNDDLRHVLEGSLNFCQIAQRIEILELF